MPPVGSWLGHDHAGTAPNLGMPVGIYRMHRTEVWFEHPGTAESSDTGPRNG
jgi:hypothetical protein